MTAFDEDWMKRFFEIAKGFESSYGGWCGVRPSYSHVECVYAPEWGGTQTGISLQVPEGADAATYADEINRRLKDMPGAGGNQ